MTQQNHPHDAPFLNIPIEFFAHITQENGKSNLVAIILLSEIMRLDHQHGGWFETSYNWLSQRFGFTKVQVRDGFLALLKIDAVERDFRTLYNAEHGYTVANVLYVRLSPRFTGFTAPPERRVSPREKSGFVYIICHQNTYKIGKARDVMVRLTQIKMPHEVTVIHTIKTNNMAYAEKLLHDKFADKRLNGEWFDLSHEDLDWIKSLAFLKDERYADE